MVISLYEILSFVKYSQAFILSVFFPPPLRLRKILLLKIFILQVYFQKGCWQAVTEGEDYD